MGKEEGLVVKHTSLVVTHMDDSYSYHGLGGPEGRGWRIDSPTRTLVVGKGLDRTIVPLETVKGIRFKVTETADTIVVDKPGLVNVAPAGEPPIHKVVQPGDMLSSRPTPLIMGHHTISPVDIKGVTLRNGDRIVWSSEAEQQ